MFAFRFNILSFRLQLLLRMTGAICPHNVEKGKQLQTAPTEKTLKYKRPRQCACYGMFYIRP